MKYKVDYEGIESYWKDDYYFCEDKIFANIATLFGCRHELMFAGGFNFGYSRSDSADSNIGNGITVMYFQQAELLEKYYGIQIHKYGCEYGGEAFFELCKAELSEGRPTVVGMENCGIWPVKAGEEIVKILPFLVISIGEDNSMELIDPHELGIRRTISKEVFLASYRWGVRFQKNKVKDIAEIPVKEFIGFVMDMYHNAITTKRGCISVEESFLGISSEKSLVEYRGKNDPYAEMQRLAEDVLKMDLDQEVEGLESVLFSPFYFDLLLLYRSRLAFTKALRQIEEYKQTNIFQTIIKRVMVSSCKWNYLRMIFTNCFHKGTMDDEVRKNMSSIIKEIAEHEKMIIQEFQELYDKYEGENGIYDIAEIRKYYNTYLFKHPNWNNVDKEQSVYARYYYRGEMPKDHYLCAGEMKFYCNAAEEKEDSLVCLGQTLQFEDKIKERNYRSIALCGTVLYNEMIYDYMDILYTDGSRESVCIGFNGWIKNEYSLEEAEKVVWSGDVVKRESNEATNKRRRAVIYGKSYPIAKGKKVQGIRLPNNPFINIVGISLKK